MKRVCSILCLQGLLVCGVCADFVVIESRPGGEPVIAAGQATLAEKKVSPASTFKVVLAWAALEAGVAAVDSKRMVSDRHVPGAPKEISLQQAMFYSSNQYFIEMAGEIGRERLTELVRKSGISGDPLPEDWLKEGWASVKKGGTIKVTPMENHRFMRRVADGALASSPEIGRQLIEAMKWPSPDEGIRLCAKSGVWGGAVWMNGFGHGPDGFKVTTVMMEGSIPVRPKALSTFYQRFGATWSDALVERVATW
jgi:beta-lactamase class D